MLPLFRTGLKTVYRLALGWWRKSAADSGVSLGRLEWGVERAVCKHWRGFEDNPKQDWVVF